ncbi:MAG: LacI family transcriptional regulator, partial [Epulopiscium sp.]|nr:LacI family transcriptional regulator [Candidatus Epulonipiscium sp.]
MASIKDVAKLAGVGVGTVSRVINNNKSVSDATREKVKWAIEQLDYVPNEVARNFKKQSSQLVGMMIPTIAHPYFSKLVFYVESELYKHGYKLLICNSETEKEKELQYIEMLK